jgi:glutaminyl-tRNA synthetase
VSKDGEHSRDDGSSRGTDFLRTIVQADLDSGKHGGKVLTRFPPEPNGYLHIGHAKSICINCGIAMELGDGSFNLRYDDTNPAKEDTEYVDSILADIRWLGFDPGERVFFASDYFEQLYFWAEELVEKGKAYVCSLDDGQVREYRGTVMEAGRPSPDRDRPAAESLDLLRRMRAGEFADGTYTLRARIDMANPNMKMRDPPIYRIRHQHHHRTGDDWCIYPFYDFAHCLSDAIEGITHSICTLEFENNRELYDWLVDETSTPCKPEQFEFARLALTYCLMSKRKLLQLVQEDRVHGWDDPRMPTLSGMRKRGVPATAIRAFCDRIGVAKTNSLVEMSVLDECIRDGLNPLAPRVMVVLDPLKVVIENYPEGEEENFDVPFFPHDVPREGSRLVPFSREIWIEQEDFEEVPPKGFRRLAPGREVRLRHAWLLTCTDVVKDSEGKVIELRARIDPESRGGRSPDGRKVKGTIHWVSAAHAVRARIRLYDRLFADPSPGMGEVDFLEQLNPDSLIVLDEARLEPSLARLGPGEHVQFERQGYFFTDPEEHSADQPVFNRVISLKDGWAKTQAKNKTSQKLEGSRTEPAPTQAPASATPEEHRYSPEVHERIEDLIGRHGLPRQEATGLALSGGLQLFFEDTVSLGARPSSAATWVLGEVRSVLEGDALEPLRFGPSELAVLLSLIESGRVTNRNAREIFRTMSRESGQPEEILASLGLESISDGDSLAAAIDQVLAENSDSVERYRAGEKRLQGFFMGQVMRAMGGKADARELSRILAEKLKG